MRRDAARVCGLARERGELRVRARLLRNGGLDLSRESGALCCVCPGEAEQLGALGVQLGERGFGLREGSTRALRGGTRVGRVATRRTQLGGDGLCLTSECPDVV